MKSRTGWLNKMTTNRRIHSFDHLHVEAEIVELHQFFQDWYIGKLERSKENFDRLENALADGFRIVTPNAQIIERQPLIDGIENAHNTQVAMRIWIEDVHIQHWLDDHVLATYQEWQEKGGETTTRLSSVLFKRKPENPHGLEWLFVHETWM